MIDKIKKSLLKDWNFSNLLEKLEHSPALTR